MNTETLRILDSIARDRNIDRDLLIQDLEQAMISAARKHFNSLDTEEFGCEMDRINGQIRIWRNQEDGTQEDIPLEVAITGDGIQSSDRSNRPAERSRGGAGI